MASLIHSRDRNSAQTGRAGLWYGLNRFHNIAKETPCFQMKRAPHRPQGYRNDITRFLLSTNSLPVGTLGQSGSAIDVNERVPARDAGAETSLSPPHCKPTGALTIKELLGG